MLFCLICEKSVSKKYDTMQHINTTQYKDKNKAKLNQQLITSNVGEQLSSNDTFSKDLCLVSSDIPLWKLNNVPIELKSSALF